MANYTRQHDFSVKDALTTGDPDKVIKGSEVDEEFDALVTSSATKIDVVSGHTTNDLVYLNSVGQLVDAGILYTDVCTLSGTQTLTGAKTLSGAATFGSTVTLNADPTLDLQAVTKQYVDNRVYSTFVEFENTTSNISTSTTASSAIDSQTINIPTRGTIALRSVACQWANAVGTTNHLMFHLRIGTNLYQFCEDSVSARECFMSAGSGQTTTTTGSTNTNAGTMGYFAMDIESAGFVSNADTGSQTVEIYAIQDASTGTLNNSTTDFRALIEIIDMS